VPRCTAPRPSVLRAPAPRRRIRATLAVPLGAAVLALTGCAGPVGATTAGPPDDPAPATAAPSAAPVPAGTADPPEPPASATAPAASTGGGPATAAAALETLAVKGRAPRAGYDREQFGPAWQDVDGNGCDTRNDVLARDLVDVVHRAGSDGCTVLSGTLLDPYTATTIDFVRGPATSSDVQVDHVVALSDAWQKGARQLDAGTRARFANDPLNLLAVDGPTNQAKGDGDAATWLPPNRAFRCDYVARQIAVKAGYGLWVTAAEKDAMGQVLGECPGQVVPADPEPAPGAGPVTGPGAAPEPTAPGPATPSPAAPAPTDPYPHCSAVYADGLSHLTPAHPRWQPRLDGNGDGVGCENP
jgi:hypothetical protein